MIIVTHGLLARLFVMRFLKYSVDEFNRWRNLRNGEVVVIEKGPDGRFALQEKMPHRDEENLKRDKERRELARRMSLRRVQTALEYVDNIEGDGGIEARLMEAEEGDIDGV
jgi:hypothetical protein